MLLISVLVVSASFALLLSAAETTKVTVDQDLAEHWRTTYDILVRPPGNRSSIEQKYGLIPGNHLSGITGGITFEQYETIKQLPGIEVAAPIATLSYFDIVLDLHPFSSGRLSIPEPGLYFQRTTFEVDDNVQKHISVSQRYYYFSPEAIELPQDAVVDNYAQGLWMLYQPAEDYGSVEYNSNYLMPVLLAAIDPEQEAKLVGLDKAMTRGHYLEADGVPERIDLSGANGNTTYYKIPLIFNEHSYVQARVIRELWRITPPDPVHSADDLISRGGLEYLSMLPASLIDKIEVTHEDVYELLGKDTTQIYLQSYGADTRGGYGTELITSLEPVQYEEIHVPSLPLTPILKAIPHGLSECRSVDH